MAPSSADLPCPAASEALESVPDEATIEAAVEAAQFRAVGVCAADACAFTCEASAWPSKIEVATPEVAWMRKTMSNAVGIQLKARVASSMSMVRSLSVTHHIAYPYGICTHMYSRPMDK